MWWWFLLLSSSLHCGHHFFSLLYYYLHSDYHYNHYYYYYSRQCALLRLKFLPRGVGVWNECRDPQGEGGSSDWVPSLMEGQLSCLSLPCTGQCLWLSIGSGFKITVRSRRRVMIESGLAWVAPLGWGALAKSP